MVSEKAMLICTPGGVVHSTRTAMRTERSRRQGEGAMQETGQANERSATRARKHGHKLKGRSKGCWRSPVVAVSGVALRL